MTRGMLKFAAIALAISWMGLAMAAPDVGQAQKQEVNIHAIVMFFIFVMACCLITFLVTAFLKIDPEFGKKK